MDFTREKNESLDSNLHILTKLLSYRHTLEKQRLIYNKICNQTITFVLYVVHFRRNISQTFHFYKNEAILFFYRNI